MSPTTPLLLHSLYTQRGSGQCRPALPCPALTCPHLPCPDMACPVGLNRGSERGTARPEVLEALLSTTDRVVQEIDSVEYGLTDIQEYYANTGALFCLFAVCM